MDGDPCDGCEFNGLITTKYITYCTNPCGCIVDQEDF